MFAPGKEGQGVATNGSGQFVDTSASLLDTNGNYSATAWVKLNKAGGALVATKPACMLDATSTGNTVIGRGEFGGNPVDHLDGVVDQVHLFDRGLDATEVKALYDSGR